MARMLRSLFGGSNQHHQARQEGSVNTKQDFRNMRYNDLFDLYINDEDIDQRLSTPSAVAAVSAENKQFHHCRKVSEPFYKGEFTIYDHIVDPSRPVSASTSQVDQVNSELTFSVCFNLGYQYERGKLLSEALSTYSQIVKNKQFTQGGRLRINMGNIYYKQENYPLAIKMYRMALDQTPNSYKETRFKIMRNIGVALMQIGEYQDAMQSFEAVMEIKYDHQAGYNLIVCYYIVGNTEKMKSCFTKMLLVRHYDPDIDDDIEDDLMELPKNDELVIELQLRQSQAHKYIFMAARIIAPVIGSTFVEGYDWIISILKDQQYLTLAHEIEMDKAIYYLHKKQFGNAISLLKTFERKEKVLMICASTNLSFVYFLEGDIDNAKKYAELALSTNTINPHALVNLGNCLFKKDDAEGAAELYRKAIDMCKDCVEACYNLGLAQKKLGLLNEALETFRSLAKRLPNNLEVVYQVGHLNDVMGNSKQAIQWLQIVIASAMHDAGVLALLGNLFTKFNDETKAHYYYSESHRVYPVNMNIITFLGAFYVQHELYEKAIPIFKLASKIQPQEVKWQLMIASCYRKIGSYSEAIAKHKEILIQHPNNIECLKYLVNMCTSLGKKDEVHDYEVRLKKLEREAFSDSTTSFKRVEKWGRATQVKALQCTVSAGIGKMGKETTGSVPAHMTLSKGCGKRQRVQDKWETIDELLPM
ncbi:hypothetical protein KP509_19G033100 [Ceratopteris richardii]|uniref:Uncharacterized protein n=1 Tax=Ceratopteris richardii TaxID=49495 RepID=A0A8T2SJF2_CERRI|nr:hypothetical protein KP509_19G033100 [Ceratopteris richardii]